MRFKSLNCSLFALSLLFTLFSLGCKREKERSLIDPQRSLIEGPRGFGVSLGLFASDPRWDYEPLIKEMSALGTSQILIVIPLNQESHTSVSPALGVTLKVLNQTISQAQEQGLQVSLMPIIKLRQRQMNLWRGVLDPTKDSIWWSNYRYELKRIALVAERHHLKRLIIGAELCSLEEQVDQWRTLIKQIRGRFKGAISYSANWDHYKDVPFWSLLDEIAVTAYFPLRRQSELSDSWRRYLAELENFATGLKRPLIISEYGYPALESAMSEPWDETTSAPFNPKLQADLVSGSTEVLLSSLSIQSSVLKAAFLWNWFGFGGQRDHGYTLRGREGEQRLRQLLKSGPSALKSTTLVE